MHNKWDKIMLKGMSFYGYHGVLPEEQVLGQEFIIDLEMMLDLRPAGRSDNLDQTVNYAEVYKLVNHITVNKRYKLIEALAEHIADQVLLNFSIDGVKVKVSKPRPPVPGIYKSMAVEITRMGQSAVGENAGG